MSKTGCDLLTLTAGPMQLDLSPAQGGAIHGWAREGVPLLRLTRPGADGGVTVREHASYPLMPFSNRIAHGRFSFDGVDYILPRDQRETRHALHGNALYAPWEVAEIAPRRVLLRLASSPERRDLLFFPFSYEAEQTYEITETSLRIFLKICNTDARRFPAGFGHHLYFARHADSIIRFQAGTMWENDAQSLPAARTEIWRQKLAEGFTLDETGFDNCFEGWTGTAEIEYPRAGYRLRIEASPLFGHAVFFTPPGKDYFAFEPVTHLNDAINRKEDMARNGLRILNPGEAMQGEIILRLAPL